MDVVLVNPRVGSGWVVSEKPKVGLDWVKMG